MSPLIKEWIKKLWYIYTIEYYLAIKNDEILPFGTTWMDLEGIMLSEVSQRKTNTICFTYRWNLKNNINERKKQTNRYRKRTDSRQRGGSWRLEKDKGIEKCRLAVTKSQGGVKNSNL